MPTLTDFLKGECGYDDLDYVLWIIRDEWNYDKLAQINRDWLKVIRVTICLNMSLRLYYGPLIHLANIGIARIRYLERK